MWTGATSGDHVIVSRATDAIGRVQPTEEQPGTKKSFLEHNVQAPRKVKIAQTPLVSVSARGEQTAA